jgi:3-phytase
VVVQGVGIVHILGSHPTPPVFDDGTATEYPDPNVADWNGLRNHDEIRFWADYIDPHRGRYIYDDRQWRWAGGKPKNPWGGLRPKQRFIIVGDQNADPVDGDATFNPIDLLLSNAQIDTSVIPASAGAAEQVPPGLSNRDTKTASFNLRADYALPSVVGWELLNGWVFWPETTDAEAYLLGASDHRMVVIDVDRDNRAFPWWRWGWRDKGSSTEKLEEVRSSLPGGCAVGGSPSGVGAFPLLALALLARRRRRRSSRTISR